jgi:hypothetical protein
LKKSLLALAPVLALLVTAPAHAYDKCATVADRMKALKEASHLKDYPKLASCFAPPYDGGGMKTLLEAAAKYDLAFPRLYEAAGRKLQGDELSGLNTGHELLSPVHVLVSGDIQPGDVKPGKSGEPSAAGYSWKIEDSAEPESGYFYLVEQDGDWRILLDGPDVWPKGDWTAAGKAVTEVAACLEKALIELESLTKEFDAETPPTKDAANDKLAAASASVHAAWKALEAGRSAAIEKAKANEAADAAASAKAAEKAAADKAAADQAAADKAAADKAAAEKARKEASKPAAKPVVATPPAATTPAASSEESKPDEPPKEEGIATGTIVVFVVLAVACAIVVGMIISRAKGEGKAAGRGAAKRSKGGSGSARNKGTGRKKRPRGPKKGDTQRDDEESASDS